MSKIMSKSRTRTDVTSIVRKESAILEVEGKRGVNLDFNFNSIVSV
jgi:hypothetical protein